MILTPIEPQDLPAILATFAAALPRGSEARDGVVRAAFARIAEAPRTPLSAAEEDHARAAAVALAHRLGIATLDEEPARAFSWDGGVVRTRSEPSVVLHEIAHWQICPPARRHLPDLGLGAGPETGRKDEADAARAADLATQEREEAMASLLGILWEADLGLPAIAAFAEQNWLEKYDRPGTPGYFATVIGWLFDDGLIDEQACPAAVEVQTAPERAPKGGGEMVLPSGIEPPTYALPRRCSTPELRQRR